MQHVVFVLLLAGIFIKLYCTETAEILFEHGANFKPIGGWLIVIAIGLSFSVLALFVSLCGGTYFDLAKWNAHLNNQSDNAFKMVFMFEAFGNTLLMCYALFCLVLLLNKRDILPKFIIWLYVGSLVFFSTDYIWAKSIFHDAVSDASLSTAIRTGIVCAIWIPYFLRSERVAQTFIVPFPSTNYRYEKVEDVMKL